MIYRILINAEGKHRSQNNKGMKMVQRKGQHRKQVWDNSNKEGLKGMANIWKG